MIDKEKIRDAYPVQSAWIDAGYPEPRNWRNCNSPFRIDTNPSFSIFDDGRRWMDFGTNEKGDVFSFVGKVNKCDFIGSKNIIINRLGWGIVGSIVQRQPDDRKQLRLPEMHPGTKSEISTLAKSRSLSFESIKWASDYRFLTFVHMKDNEGIYSAYILSDSSHRNAQARRLDGECWQHLPGKPKAKTLPGSQAGWPIGIADLGNKPHVAFCEGGPDFLSSIHFALIEGKENFVAPVCMCGASLNIHPQALGLFTSKNVRIFSHLDDAGISATKKWAKQLYRAGVKSVDAYAFDGLTQSNGNSVCDLNDLTRQDVDCWEENFHSRELFNFNQT